MDCPRTVSGCLLLLLFKREMGAVLRLVQSRTCRSDSESDTLGTVPEVIAVMQ